jgi:hypothetical protein
MAVIRSGDRLWHRELYTHKGIIPIMLYGSYLITTSFLFKFHGYSDLLFLHLNEVFVFLRVLALNVIAYHFFMLIEKPYRFRIYPAQF